MCCLASLLVTIVLCYSGVGLLDAQQSGRSAAERQDRKVNSRRILDAAALKGFLSKKLHKLPLSALMAAVHDEDTPQQIDAAGCEALLGRIGINNAKLAAAIHSFFDPGKTGIIDKREVAMSLSVLCSASSQSAKLDFAFKLFDEDEDKNLSEAELVSFFQMFRNPIMSVINRSMEVFYDTCGYRDEFKQVIAKLAQDTFEDHVKAIVADAFSSDLDANKHLDAVEFVAWSGANKNVGKWVDNLSRLVLDSLAAEVTIDDFQPGDFAFE